MGYTRTIKQFNKFLIVVVQSYNKTITMDLIPKKKKKSKNTKEWELPLGDNPNNCPEIDYLELVLADFKVYTRCNKYIA